VSAIAPAPTVAAALDEAVRVLARAGVERSRVEAEWLLAGLLGVGRARLGLDAHRRLAAPQTQRYEDAVRRRARREPLQRILGWEQFRGLAVRLTPDVLVPRPETELLVDWALELLPTPTPGGQLRAIDVGTGSGCIACALASERADVEVAAVEVSPAAAMVAKRNARALRLDVRVLVSDLLTATADTSMDLIVANLPYVPDALIDTLAPEVSEHEPRLALSGGADGLAVIRRLPSDAYRVLRPRGALAVETLGAAQAQDVASLLGTIGFVDVAIRGDLAGVQRFVGGRRP
jgi:release factor glutamine methyltransferase